MLVKRLLQVITWKPHIQLLIAFLLIFGLSLFKLLQIMNQQWGGIMVGVLFCFFYLSLVTVVCSSIFLGKRRRLFHFFGISHQIPNISIYVSRLYIPPHGSEGTESVTEGYVGNALTEQDYDGATKVRDLFRSNILALMPEELKGIFRKIDVKIGVIFADIDPLVKPSPSVEEFASDNSKYLSTNLIIIGSQIYNTVSGHYLRPQLTPPFRFRKNKKNERVLEELNNLPYDTGYVGIPGRPMRELAIIQRIKDQDHETSVFICAGLGASSTLGSADYLKNNWRDLQRTFGSYDFAFCLEFEGQEPNSINFVKPTRTHEKWRKCDRSDRSANWMNGTPQIKKHRSNNLT